MKKKLTLKKDTLRDLTVSDLKHVVGASDNSVPSDFCYAAAASGACNSL